MSSTRGPALTPTLPYRIPRRARGFGAARIATARADPRPAVQTFAATLAHTGARISEVLAIRAGDVNVENSEVRIATLKRRREHWRCVPVPEALIHILELVHRLRRTQRGSGPSRGRPPPDTSPS